MTFLPGLMTGMMMGAAAATLTTLWEAANATSTGETITGPAGILAGDLIVLLDRADDSDSSAPASVVPTGFTAISDVHSNGPATRQILSYKLADGTEASATITGMVGASSTHKALYVFRGNIDIAEVTIQDADGVGQTGNPAAQTITASGGAAPLIVIGAFGALNTITESFTPAEDDSLTVTGSEEIILAYKIYDSSPANVTIDQGDHSGMNGLQGCYIECSGAAATPLTLEYITKVTGTGTSITLPSDIEVGDILIFQSHHRTPSVYTPALPSDVSGFTAIGRRNVTFNSAGFFVKLADAADADRVISGLLNETYNCHQCVVLRPSKTVTAISPGGNSANITNATPSNETIPAGTAPSLQIAAYSDAVGAYTAAWSGDGWDDSQRYDPGIGVLTTWRLWPEDTTPTTATASKSDENNGNYIGVTRLDLTI